jgi:methionine biosynthesis protein MetW
MRIDHRTIVEWVPAGSRVLDLGCGGGELLAALTQEKGVRGVGLELSLEAVQACISRGVSAYQGDLDQGLADLRSDTYDYVILNQTLQMMRNPRFVISEAKRVGHRLIVGFPNYGYWYVRAQVLRGHTPVTRDLPYSWFDTPNLHVLSLVDFRTFATQERLRVRREAHFREDHRVRIFPNLLASTALVELEAS